MEYLGNDLKDDLKDGFFPEDDARIIIKQVLDGLNYLHNQGISHRDVKIANIVKAHANKPKSMDIKLVDMGFSMFFEKSQGMEGCCGSPIYMAPEIFLGHKYTENVDIWAVGITLFKLMVGDSNRYSPYVEKLACVQDMIQLAKGLVKKDRHEIPVS